MNTKEGLIDQAHADESSPCADESSPYKEIKTLQFFAHDNGGLWRVMIIVLFYPQNIKT
jgi:hypothetical protein